MPAMCQAALKQLKRSPSATLCEPCNGQGPERDVSQVYASIKELKHECCGPLYNITRHGSALCILGGKLDTDRRAGGERAGMEEEGKGMNSARKLWGNGCHGYSCLGNHRTHPFLCTGAESE